MKEVQTSFYWDYPWKLFTFGNFNKYPNEFASHVISVDVLNRHITSEGYLITDRLLQLKQPIPSILRKLGLPIPETSFFLERSTLDPVTQHYEATSYNLSMRSLFHAIEVCSFKQDPTTGGTQFEQRAKFTACSLFSRLVEEAAVSRFESNAARGRMGMQSVLSKLHNEVDWFKHEFEQHMMKAKKTMNQLEHQLDDLEIGLKSRINSQNFWTGFKTSTALVEDGCSGKWYSPSHHNPFC